MLHYEIQFILKFRENIRKIKNYDYEKKSKKFRKARNTCEHIESV